jgi:hypothetical protein
MAPYPNNFTASSAPGWRPLTAMLFRTICQRETTATHETCLLPATLAMNFNVLVQPYVNIITPCVIAAIINAVIYSVYFLLKLRTDTSEGSQE